MSTSGAVSELQRYIKVLVLGMVLFGLSYWYTSWQQTPNPLNKAVADTSVLLIGLSMLVSSICYFFNFLDFSIIYRKHIGLLGFAFGFVHIGLSFSALQRLFMVETWQQGSYWPALTGLVAIIIFGFMALISNTFSATVLGGSAWRKILRMGYLAMLLVLAHVYLLKSGRWMTWYNEGLQSPPSMSFMVFIFIVFVVIMRILLWLAVRGKQTIR